MHKMCKSDIGPSADTKHKLLNRKTDGLGGGAGGRGVGIVQVKDAKQINIFWTLTLLITDLMILQEWCQSSVSSSKSFTADMMIQQREMRIAMQCDRRPEQIIMI